MYETRKQQPLARSRFVRRLLVHLAASVCLLCISLGIGIWGYVFYEGLTPLDAFLNASMLLGGMGPLAPLQTPGGKLFAGLYALYAGLVFIVSTALILTPILHRVLHKFHWDSNL